MDVKSTVMLCSQGVVIRINLEKYYHGLNEKLITATDILEESALKVWQFNKGKNQEFFQIFLNVTLISILTLWYVNAAGATEKKNYENELCII